MQNAQTHNFEVFNASKFRVGIVCAEFNGDITSQILSSTLEKLKDYQVKTDNINTYHVTGSVELPVILQTLAKTKKYDCLIAIGAIIKGQTDHYEYVAKIVVDGTLKISLEHNLPIGFAVLTTPNKELAQARIDIGAEAVEAVLHNAKIIQQIII